jgi:hypothetical protein
VFFFRGLVTERAEIIGQSGQTLRLIFRCESSHEGFGRKITAVAFRAVDKFIELLSENYSEEAAKDFASGRLKNLNIKMDIACNLRINTYMGNSSLQLVLIDFAANGFKGGHYES